MKTFSLSVTVEDDKSADELVERLEAALEAMKLPFNRRFINFMNVDDAATFGETVDIEPVEMARHE